MISWILRHFCLQRYFCWCKVISEKQHQQHQHQQQQHHHQHQQQQQQQQQQQVDKPSFDVNSSQLRRINTSASLNKLPCLLGGEKDKQEDKILVYTRKLILSGLQQSFASHQTRLATRKAKFSSLLLRACACMRLCTHTHLWMQIRTRIHPLGCTPTHAHTCAHASTHTHTCAHASTRAVLKVFWQRRRQGFNYNVSLTFSCSSILCIKRLSRNLITLKCINVFFPLTVWHLGINDGPLRCNLKV